MKKNHGFLCAFLLCLVFSSSSHALICQSEDGKTDVSATVNTTVAVSNALAKRTVLWRQEIQTIEAICWVDVQNGPAENVYFHLLPNEVGLGDDLEIGVTYNNLDYFKFDPSGGVLNTGVKLLKCNWDAEKKQCTQQRSKVTFKYSVFLSKKSASGPPKEGALSGLASFVAFQLDSVGSVRPGQNYNLTLNGLNNIRYISCDSKVSISPDFLDFGGVPASSAQVGRVIRSLPFVVSEQRGCSAVYGVNLAFRAKNAWENADNTLIVPGNNKTLGIRIVDAEKNKALVLRREYEFSPVGSELFYSKRFLAELSWLSQTPKLGRFDAGAIVDVYYK